METLIFGARLFLRTDRVFSEEEEEEGDPTLVVVVVVAVGELGACVDVDVDLDVDLVEVVALEEEEEAIEPAEPAEPVEPVEPAEPAEPVEGDGTFSFVEAKEVEDAEEEGDKIISWFLGLLLVFGKLRICCTLSCTHRCRTEM